MIETLKCPICGKKLKPTIEGFMFTCGHNKTIKEFGKPIFNKIESKDSFVLKTTKFDMKH